MPVRFVLILLTASLILSSCGSSQRGPDPIAEVFVGPATLNLRQELAPRSPVVATVKHGERLDVLQTRRRFVQVRTGQGAVGWTDSRQLMTPEQMRQLQTLADDTKSYPSQGEAIVYEPLNVHTEPARMSPSFARISEKTSVQVIAHKLAPRVTTASAAPLVPKKARPDPLPKKKKKEAESRRTPPPPMPAPPKPPPNWLQLSQAELLPDEAKGAEDDAAKDEPKPVPVEDWSLIRMKDGRVGWVLTRMLILSIPDEVAQYAEGHRITSYFALSDIPDQDQMKHAWLWTTIEKGGQPYEFDGFRVFTWNTKRHRYETVYRERNLTGYYPVKVERATADKSATTQFSLIIEQDGGRVRKTYAFNGYRVSLLSKEPVAVEEQGGAQSQEAGSGTGLAIPSAKRPPKPWYSRLTDRVRGMFR